MDGLVSQEANLEADSLVHVQPMELFAHALMPKQISGQAITNKPSCNPKDRLYASNQTHPLSSRAKR